MNIILVVIDTLRYDYIAANGNNWIHTPNLDALAERSWCFDNAFAASYPTIPHRTDLLTGLYGGPFHSWRPLPFDVATLPRLLADAGYATQLIHDTPHLVNGGHNFDWPFHAWTFIRGGEVDRPWIDDSQMAWPDNWDLDPVFDYVGPLKDVEQRSHVAISYTRANRKRRSYEDWNAAQLFLTAARFLRDNARRDNFFLMVDSFDPHEPWDAPPEYVLRYDHTPGYDGRFDPRSLFSGQAGERPDAAADRLRAFYAAKVTWVDRWFGELLRALEETHLLTNTAIVVTADHGTNVGECGQFGKTFPIKDTEAHVPLMIYVPDGGSGRSDVFAQPQDITATILGLGKAAKPDDIDAYDVLAAARNGQDSPRQCVISGRHIHNWDGEADQILLTIFDRQWRLEFAASPQASRLYRRDQYEDVAAGHPSVVRDLRARALDQVGRRGAHPDLLAWLRSEGRSPFPADRCQDPAPPGYAHYWDHAYRKW
ncbi:MAG TPA: sulfatase [Phycisphaerae bacterium]|nr:sulfatase [Phycisphaerae bacterium]